MHSSKLLDKTKIQFFSSSCIVLSYLIKQKYRAAPGFITRFCCFAVIWLAYPSPFGLPIQLWPHQLAATMSTIYENPRAQPSPPHPTPWCNLSQLLQLARRLTVFRNAHYFQICALLLELVQTVKQWAMQSLACVLTFWMDRTLVMIFRCSLAGFDLALRSSGSLLFLTLITAAYDSSNNQIDVENCIGFPDC